MAIEKITPIWVRFASKCFTSAVLYTLVAYAWPMHRCTASAAGGMSQRLKPGPATERSRESSPDTVVVMSTMSSPTAPGACRGRPGARGCAQRSSWRDERSPPPAGQAPRGVPARSTCRAAGRLLRSGKEDTDVDATPRRPRPRGRHPRHPLGVGRPARRGERGRAGRRSGGQGGAEPARRPRAGRRGGLGRRAPGGLPARAGARAAPRARPLPPGGHGARPAGSAGGRRGGGGHADPAAARHGRQPLGLHPPASRPAPARLRPGADPELLPDHQRRPGRRARPGAPDREPLRADGLRAHPRGRPQHGRADRALLRAVPRR